MSDFNTLFYYKREDGTWSDDLSGWANRAFLFGDGIFETMIFIHGQIRFSKYHMQRLQEGMEVLGIYPDRLTSLDSLEHFLCELPVSNESLRVRWNIYREGLGKYAPDDNFSKETLQIEPLKKTGTVKFNSYISQGVYTPQTYWSHCKTLSALTYVMASKEKLSKDMDEVVILNTKGFVSEAGSSNIFWLKNGVYYTPSLSCSCIAGIARGRIIQRLKDIGKTVIEGEFLPEVILSAEKVFTSNVTGISYLYKLEDSKYDTTPDPWIESIFEME